MRQAGDEIDSPLQKYNLDRRNLGEVMTEPTNEPNRDIYTLVWCPQCKTKRRIYEGEMSKNDFPMCNECFLPMKVKAVHSR